MAPINDDAIVLRTVDFSETSMVVTFYTREHGKIACLAKGARRLKNPFDTALDAMNSCRILYYPKAGDTLQLVTEAKLIDRFRITSIVPAYAGFHVVHLLDRFTENFNPQFELFDLTRTTLNDIVSLDSECVDAPLDGPPEKMSRCLLHFEMRLLALAGFAPELNACVECGEVVDVKRLARAAFGMADGGVLCAKCRPGHRTVVSLSSDALGAMRMLASSNPQYWRRLQLSSKVLGEVRGVWNRFLTYQLESPLEILQWLKR